MYPTNLNTNEVKDATGAEVEYLRSSGPDSVKGLVFAKSGEVPSQTDRLSAKHQEIGSGLNAVRRSRVGFDIVIPGQVDTTKTCKIQVYAVAVVPTGQLTSLTAVNNAMAKLVSHLASRGASTTILYDGTGVGAEALINGSY